MTTKQTTDRPLACIACADGNGLRTVTLSPWGEVKSLKGTYFLDEEGAAEIVAGFNEHGVALPIDQEHETPSATPPGQRRGAVGWIERVWAEVGKGLMGMVKWTDRGRELIRTDAYRYLSPTLMIDNATRRAVALHSAALTVRPAIPRMEKLAASRDAETETTAMADKDRCGEIAGLLDVKLEGDDTEAAWSAIVAKIKALVKAGAQAEAMSASDADSTVAHATRSVLGLSGTATEKETLIALGQVCLAAMNEKDRTLKINALIEPWIRKGVLNPDSKHNKEDYGQMVSLALASPDIFENVMRGRYANFPAQGRTTPPPSGDNKKHRGSIIRNAAVDFQSDPGHARVTTVQKFVNLALIDEGESVMHKDELGLLGL